jgi:SHS2 domain-containing protein
MTYRWVDHTAELELHIAAPDEAAVFAEALRAFRDLVGDGRRDGRPDERPDGRRGEPLSFDVELDSSDRATLLVRWLDELVYRAETEDLVPDAVERLELSDDGLAATVRGYRAEPRHVVKGVTYHALQFARGADGYRATVVLDV